VSRADIIARLSVVVAATCFAFGGIFSTDFYDAGGDPATLVALRFVLAAIAFGAWLAISGVRRLPRRDVMLAVALGAAQLGYTAALVYGFEVAPVSLVVLLFYTYPVLVTVGAMWLFGERLTTVGVVLVGIAAVGLVLAIGAPSTVTFAGIACGLGAGIGHTIVILSSRGLMQRGLRIPEIATLSYAGPAVVCLVLVITGVIALPPSSAAGLAPGLAFAIIGSAMPYVLFYRAIAVIGAALAALLATLEPFVAVSLAFALLGERLSALQLAGGALILAATTALALSARSRPVVATSS
jgi:drug/metabolite transporter (DMT)-like permease